MKRNNNCHAEFISASKVKKEILKQVQDDSKKVLVAMSGGVDSSVTAALLQKQGYSVVGVFLKLTNRHELSANRREYKTDEESAREVAKILGIKLKVVDARKEFKKEIIDYFLREYKAGKTPNPCVACNPKIKFATIIKLADTLGIKYIATGHYARIFPLPLAPSPLGRGWILPRKPGEGNKLFEAKDKNKDQSYFLYGLNQKQLERIIFILANFKKPEVKEIARKMELPVYNREESHDVCFISGKLEEYLKKNLKLKKGKIINLKGKILGEHNGLPLYTIGQRKGINLGGPGPYYVIGKNIPKNELIITGKVKDSKLFQKSMLVEKVNWIGNVPKFPLIAHIRIRYGHPAVGGIIKTHNTKHIAHNKILEIEFEKPQRAITPGQSAVFYGKNKKVLGGGIIRS